LLIHSEFGDRMKAKFAVETTTIQQAVPDRNAFLRPRHLVIDFFETAGLFFCQTHNIGILDHTLRAPPNFRTKVRESSIISCAICQISSFGKRRYQRLDMRASAPPATIKAAPTTNAVHPRKRRSGEMLETALRAPFLSARERPLFVSCTMETSP